MIDLLKKIKEHLEKGGMVDIRGWCIKTVEQLESPDEVIMEVGRNFGADMVRKNTFLKELEMFPDYVSLVPLELDIDTSNQNDIICPHCGHITRDPWELDEGLCTCSFCENNFYLNKNYTVKYTTEKE